MFFFQKIQCFAIDFEHNVMEKVNKSTTFKISNSKRSFKKPSELGTGSEKQVISEMLGAREIPPIELNIDCGGNSFSLGSQPFIPMIKVVPKNDVIFSPCGIGQTTFSSIQLINKTDTPSSFKFDVDTSNIFDVFPKNGIIEGHKFKIIFLKFQPTEANMYTKVLHCKLNGSADSIKIRLSGYCCIPSLDIDNGGQIFFPPSYTGVYSKQKILFQNKSRVPLEYRINIPKKYKDELIFNPPQASLLPNQSSYVL